MAGGGGALYARLTGGTAPVPCSNAMGGCGRFGGAGAVSEGGPLSAPAGRRVRCSGG